MFLKSSKVIICLIFSGIWLCSCGQSENELLLYEYTNELGTEKLSFVWDESANTGYGTCSFESSEELSDVDFSIKNVREEIWERDIFALTSYNGRTGENEVTDYTEEFIYSDDNKILQYTSKGTILYYDGEKPDFELLDIKFDYREDGTLQYRNYTHSSYVFGTSLMTLNSLFDEQERLVYEEGYITHGHVEYYYIYTDEDDKPDYCLYLDWMGGECWAEIIKYQ